ncbi:UNVERIFIED_CONTAM: hypothetical protein HDU68_002086, partial [Siphonaria sp. JEL0065]
MNLDHLKEELNEFEDFVENYSRQMAEILSDKDITAENDKKASINSSTLIGVARIDLDAKGDGGLTGEPVKPPIMELPQNKQPEKTAAVAAESDSKKEVKPHAQIPKIPKTSLDYSRFEQIDDKDEPEPIPPKKEAPAPSPEKLKETKQKPYSLKTNAIFKTVQEKILDIANQQKNLGNEAIRVANPSAAVRHYTDAIETCLHPKRQQIADYEKAEKSANAAKTKEAAAGETPDPFGFLDRLNLPDPEPVTPESSLYSNRAYARLCLLEYAHAAQDCDAVLDAAEKAVPDQIRLKTLWRRSLANRALNKLELSKRDLDMLVSSLKMPTATTSLTVGQPKQSVALADAERALRICEQQISHSVGDQSLKEAVEAASDKVDLPMLLANPGLDSSNVDPYASIYLNRKSFETVFLRFVEGIALRVRECAASTKGGPHSPQPVVVIESPSIKSHQETLIDFLEANPDVEPSPASIFRLYGGFDKLFADSTASTTENQPTSMISPSSIHLILPVLLAAASKSDANMFELSKPGRLTKLMKAVLECPLVFSNTPTPTSVCGSTLGIQLIGQAARLVTLCVTKEACLFEITLYSNMNKECCQVWNIFVKTALDMLNFSNVPDSKRIHPSLPEATSEIAVNLVSFVNQSLKFTPSGAVTLIQKWGCTPSALVSALEAWFAKSLKHKTPEPVILAVSECLTTLLDVCKVNPLLKLLPILESFLNKFVLHLVAAIRDTNRIGYKEFEDKSLVCLHNLITICAGPFDDGFLVQSDVIPVIVRYLGEGQKTKTKSSTSVALATFAKLQARNPKQIAKDLDGWWDELRMVERLSDISIGLLSDIVEDGSFLDNSGNWIQLLAGWLQQNQDLNEQGRVVAGWKQEGGFESLLRLMKAVVKVVSEQERNGVWVEKIDRLVGNVGLALAECMKKEENGKYFHNAGLTDLLVDLLRVVSKRPLGQSSAQKNISIACARLCQYDSARERVRELQGMELLYNLGSK